ncbi:DUF411 domain-containing protein [Roseibium litorale]|uniref:DUF411 domain-containing protein n=1 Tax=Roseibium litorale TaxID=2803841 RepID=A0ABR9CNV0_9HYPH|nr:DUF411 domain-containing protein [Roseibium litorale]MBD8892536.1 DUF411 domain-containing protein [Roseibium litorale]
MTRRIAAFLLIGSALSVSQAAFAAGDGNTITVYKSPWCGCCEIWTDAAREAGFQVVIEDMEDLSGVKQQAGVPEEMQACHTAVIGDDRKYIIEGHVPLEAIRKMMTERPDVRGIAVPGMPQGSLGMSYDPTAKYTVFTFGSKASGAPQPYMRMGE